jgi:hypothetical protein
MTFFSLLLLKPCSICSEHDSVRVCSCWDKVGRKLVGLCLSQTVKWLLGRQLVGPAETMVKAWQYTLSTVAGRQPICRIDKTQITLWQLRSPPLFNSKRDHIIQKMPLWVF